MEDLLRRNAVSCLVFVYIFYTNIIVSILNYEISKTFVINITPKGVFNKDLNKILGRIGIKSEKPGLIKLDIMSSFYYSIHDTYNLTISWLKGLFTLISLKASKNDVAGPIGIAKISGNALTSGLVSIVFLM